MASRSIATLGGIGVFTLALAALLWTAYDGAQRLFPDWRADTAKGTTAANGSLNTTAPEAQYDVSKIIAAHLFGNPQAPAEEPASVPETKLRINLMGLIASSDERFARAIIGVNDSKVQTYAVGENIEGTDASIHAVENRRVLLKRDNAVESLFLKRDNITDAGAPPDLPTSRDGGDAPAASEPDGDPEINEIRQGDRRIRLRQPF